MIKNSLKVILFTFFFLALALSNIYLLSKLFMHLYASSNYEALLDEIAHAQPNPKEQQAVSSESFSLKGIESEMKFADARASNLRSFLARYNSVLYDHADKIVAEADKYGFDYRLLVAIAFQESTLCKKIPVDSHNCWGWGIYGNNVIRFASYDEGIEKVSKGIKENYLDKGLITASQVMAKYAPSSPGSWAFGVNTFLNKIEEK